MIRARVCRAALARRAALPHFEDVFEFGEVLGGGEFEVIFFVLENKNIKSCVTHDGGVVGGVGWSVFKSLFKRRQIEYLRSLGFPEICAVGF